MKKILMSIISFVLMCSCAVPVLASDGEEPDSFPALVYLIIALAVGFLISLIINLVNRGQLKSVKPNDAAEDYVENVDITASRDLFLYSKVEKTRKNNSNDR